LLSFASGESIVDVNPLLALGLIVAAFAVRPALASTRWLDLDTLVESARTHQPLEYLQIEHLGDPAQIRILRNAVYASRGYSFASENLKAYFSKLPWYKPALTNVDALLDDNDRTNLESIGWAEAHAALLALVSPTGSQARTISQIEESFVGLWQDSLTVADGWSGTLAFFANGMVIERPPQEECRTKRLVARIAYWSVERRLLTMRYFAEQRLVGGTLSRDEACGPAAYLVGGAAKIVMLPAPLEQARMLTGPTQQSPGRATFVLDGNVQYWKFQDDPADYD
jgi:hypothetical protein